MQAWAGNKRHSALHGVRCLDSGVLYMARRRAAPAAAAHLATAHTEATAGLGTSQMTAICLTYAKFSIDPL